MKIKTTRSPTDRRLDRHEYMTDAGETLYVAYTYRRRRSRRAFVRWIVLISVLLVATPIFFGLVA